MKAVEWNMIVKTFYDRMDEERKRLGMTKDELADACEIDREGFALYEGHRIIFPYMTQVIRIAEVCGCSVDYLLGLSDDRQDNTLQ